MDWLCTDIKLIVYRYLHQYRYSEVRKQYNDYFNKGDVYWYDAMECFVSKRQARFVFNWRCDGYTSAIRRIKVGPTGVIVVRRDIPLPRNYNSIPLHAT
jgi:hypothetical protein